MNGAQFLDPAVLARIDNLDLIARTVVDGFLNGLHRSPYLGFSLDFAEHRQYMPGDDIRRIDWKLYGRTDRFYVKEFEADTNANFTVLLDVSKSMSYASGSVSKLDYARILAATLVYFSRQQRDRIGLVTFNEDIVDFVPASAKHLEVILHTLDRTTAEGQSAFDEPLLKIAEALRRRGILLVISDLYEEPERILRALNYLRHKGNDIIVFHILDSAELEFPFTAPSTFEDLESGERIPIVPEKLRDEYRELITEHVDTLSKTLGENQMDYFRFDTSTPIDFALFEYLSRREYLARVR